MLQDAPGNRSVGDDRQELHGAVKWPAGRTDKARNEPRDLYDLWYLTSAGLVDLATLIPEIETKLASRGRTREAMPGELASKEARCKKLWSVRLGQQSVTKAWADRQVVYIWNVPPLMLGLAEEDHIGCSTAATLIKSTL